MNELAQALIPQEIKEHKFHMVMLFFTSYELGIATSLSETTWVNTRNIEFDNARDAMNYYANTSCPASQHISAPTRELLEQEKQQMLKNYQDEAWLEENLYPYI